MLKMKNSVYFKWIVSYSIVLMIPIIISSAIYIQSQIILEKQIKRTNQLVLSQITKENDDAVKQLVRIGYELELNNKIDDYAKNMSWSKQQKIYQANQISKTLLSYSSISPNNEYYIYVYLRDIDLVVTETAAYNTQSFYEFFTDHSLTYEQWKANMDAVHRSDFSGGKTVARGDVLTQCIIYTKDIMSNVGTRNATLFVQYDLQKYSEQIQTTQAGAGGTSFILNKENELIYSTGNEGEYLSKLNYSILPSGEQMAKKRINGENVMVYHNISNITKWKYVTVIPMKQFMAQLNYMLFFMIIALLVMLAFGGYVVRKFAKLNYRPLDNLLSTLNIEKDNDIDEFSVIKGAIQNVIDENMHTSTQIAKQQDLVQNSFLHKLLIGEINYDSPINEMLESVSIYFPHRHFMVMMIYIDDYSRFFNGEQRLNEFERSELVKLIFTNVLGELINQEMCGKVVNSGESLFCIVNSNDNIMEQMTKIATKCQDFIYENFEINFTLALSDVHSNLQGIATAYQEAIETVQHRILLNDQCIIRYGDITNDGNSFYSLFSAKKNYFVKAVKDGNADEGKKIVKDIFGTQNNESGLSVKMSRYLVYDVINATMKMCDELLTFGSDQIRLKDELIDTLGGNKSVYEMLEIIFEVIDILCANSKKVDEKEELMVKIEDYVKENYSNGNINVLMIGEEFGLSGAYTASIFKKKTGKSLIDYLNEVRIQKSKELLIQTNLTIEQIMVKVGYSNKVTFLRLFKKYSGGITPTNFRDAQ